MSKPAQQPPTVYVVEDDEFVRNSMGRLMRAEGFKVFLFGSADDFLANAVPVPFGCVLLDLPVGGLAIQRRMLERGILLPVIAVSASEDESIRREARELGAAFYFRKPVDDRTLIDAIDWIVNSGPAAGTLN